MGPVPNQLPPGHSSQYCQTRPDLLPGLRCVGLSSCATTNNPRASWCISISRNSAVSRTAEDGAPTGAVQSKTAKPAARVITQHAREPSYHVAISTYIMLSLTIPDWHISSSMLIKMKKTAAGHTIRSPMARLSISTEHGRRNGRTRGLMTMTKQEPLHTVPGFVTVIIANPILGSVVLLPQVVLTTSVGTEYRETTDVTKVFCRDALRKQ